MSNFRLMNRDMDFLRCDRRGVQLPEAGRDPDGRRPHPALRVGAERDPDFGKRSTEEVIESLTALGMTLRDE